MKYTYFQKEILFIGENAILAPDFMFYMGQLLSILSLDQTLLAVSALNENGMLRNFLSNY